MAKRSRRGAAADEGTTHKFLEQLFESPPVQDGELAQRFKGVDRAAVRRLLVDRLSDGKVRRGDSELFSAALGLVGAAKEAERLRAIALDGKASLLARSIALFVSSAMDAETLPPIFAQLSPGDALLLLCQPVVTAIEAVEANPDSAVAVASALVLLTPDQRPSVIDYLEKERRRAGVPAILAYEKALEDPALRDVRELLVEAVIADGAVEAAATLEAMRDRASDAAGRSVFQRALLRLRTYSVDPERVLPAMPGAAWIGSCDGQGAYVVVASFELEAGSFTVADLCIRAAADVRDGMLLSDLSRAQVDELLEQLRCEGSIEFTSVPLADAAALVAEAARRTRAAKLPIPEAARAPLLRFSRIDDPRHAVPTPAPAAKPPDKEWVRRLLERPTYADSWFLDGGDLHGAGVEPPEKERPGPRWWSEALARLEQSEVRARLLAMVSHMARWHAWHGDDETAGLLQALAEATARDFRKSTLATEILRRSLAINATEETPTSAFGDPAARRHLRLRFFADVELASGRDLGRLDLTEAAISVLEQAFGALPGHLRPRQDDLVAAAHAAAVPFADFLVAKRRERVATMAEKIEVALHASLHLELGIVRELTGALMEGLLQFTTDVCRHCPVACFDRPKARMADIFFSDVHPAGSVLAGG